MINCHVNGKRTHTVHGQTIPLRRLKSAHAKRQFRQNTNITDIFTPQQIYTGQLLQ
uniref:Uncharacterized protein n=1 Tax=Anguilla anguilla TaxID=7936 RepID=A0A0E9WU38_ANGAN